MGGGWGEGRVGGGAGWGRGRQRRRRIRASIDCVDDDDDDDDDDNDELISRLKLCVYHVCRCCWHAARAACLRCYLRLPLAILPSRRNVVIKS